MPAQTYQTKRDHMRGQQRNGPKECERSEARPGWNPDGNGEVGRGDWGRTGDRFLVGLAGFGTVLRRCGGACDGSVAAQPQWPQGHAWPVYPSISPSHFCMCVAFCMAQSSVEVGDSEGTTGAFSHDAWSRPEGRNTYCSLLLGLQKFEWVDHASGFELPASMWHAPPQYHGYLPCTNARAVMLASGSPAKKSG